MTSTSNLLRIIHFDQIQFEVEQEVRRVLEPCKVVDYLVAKDRYSNNAEEVIQHLDEEFLSQFPEFLDRIVIESSAIPDDYPRLIRKKDYRIKGEIWTVHKNDIDPFPSIPHAHNYDQNLTMHLGNGNLFRKRQLVGAAKRKVFLQLRALISNVELPLLEI